MCAHRIEAVWVQGQDPQDFIHSGLLHQNCERLSGIEFQAMYSALLQKLCKLWGQQILHTTLLFPRTTCCLTHQKQNAAKEYGGSLLLNDTTS
jgi:hypothetical protein